MIIKYYLSFKLALLIFTLSSNLIFKCHTLIHPHQFPTFYDWKKACDKLPQLNINIKNFYNTPLSEEIFKQELDRFFITMQRQVDEIKWIDDVMPEIYTTNFQAIAQKVIVPNNSVIAIHGDLHGDIHSLNKFIQTFLDKGFLNKDNPFKIKNKNFYILFLGDYVDRGWYGTEVIYTILRLKNENPGNVLMVRGNHEDLDLNNRYGFSKEINKKFSSTNLISKIQQLYNLLPVVICLGSGMKNNYNFIQCCHGGIEVGFNPNNLLENKYIHAGIKISNLTQSDGFENAFCQEASSFKKYFKNNTR